MPPSKGKIAKAKKAHGRPSVYTPELAKEICDKLAEGWTLRQVCRADHMPDERTVRDWALNNVEFSPQYAKAREIGYRIMADEVLEIADDGTNDWMLRQGDNPGYEANGEHIQRSRLRVDTRKWLLSKVLPKVYGDKQTLEFEHVHRFDEMSDEAIEKLLTEAMARLAGPVIEHEPAEKTDKSG